MKATMWKRVKITTDSCRNLVGESFICGGKIQNTPTITSEIQSWCRICCVRTVFNKCLLFKNTYPTLWFEVLQYHDTITISVYGLIWDNDHTPSCLSNYSSLEFVTSNILTSLQYTCLPPSIVIGPQGMGSHMTPSPDKTMDWFHCIPVPTSCKSPWLH